jgi:hypothetical protein
MVEVPVHPAYTNPALATSTMRQNTHNVVLPGDTDKAAKVIYQLFADRTENLPLRIPLGKDTIQALRDRVKMLTTEADSVEKYSDDLAHDN